jgi:mono/diheme cytochrome c family protein
MRRVSWLTMVPGALFLIACSGDDEVGNPDAAATFDAPPVVDALVPDAETADAGPVPTAARGQYLVDHVALCSACHTPVLPGGMPDLANYLAGAECFVDIDPATDGVGCLHTRNLTNHATGLMSRSDAEIKNMFLNGVRPDGSFMLPDMPYYVFHNMTETDADSIVLYLRTVAGVDHTVPANEVPFNMAPVAPALPLNVATIPQPTVMNASTANGRYLAAMAGVCVECHTPLTNQMDASSLDATKMFAGGRGFPAAAFGLPSPPFPAMIYTENLTPDVTGIGDYTEADIVKVLKMGLDKENMGVCPPMPSGMAGFGGLTDDDAADIAAYIHTLPAIANTLPNACVAPGP